MTSPLAAFTSHSAAPGRRLEGSSFLRQRHEEFAQLLAARAQTPPASAGAAPSAAAGPERFTARLAVEPAPSRTDPAIEDGPATGPVPRGTETPTTPPPAGVLPHIPRFADVPESAQFPLGPYRQAPQEYGSEWWLVNPFTGDEPWTNYPQLLGPEGAAEGPPPEPRVLPEGFVDIFGPEPQPADFANRLQFQRTRHEWEHQLEYFGGAGTPEGFTDEDVAAVSETFRAWGLGEPVFYQGRYGWTARFPDGAVEGFQANPATALLSPHLVVAGYQIRLAQQGTDVSERHPFVPRAVFGDSAPASVEDLQSA